MDDSPAWSSAVYFRVSIVRRDKTNVACRFCRTTYRAPASDSSPPHTVHRVSVMVRSFGFSRRRDTAAVPIPAAAVFAAATGAVELFIVVQSDIDPRGFCMHGGPRHRQRRVTYFLSQKALLLLTDWSLYRRFFTTRRALCSVAGVRRRLHATSLHQKWLLGH